MRPFSDFENKFTKEMVNNKSLGNKPFNEILNMGQSSFHVITWDTAKEELIFSTEKQGEEDKEKHLEKQSIGLHSICEIINLIDYLIEQKLIGIYSVNTTNKETSICKKNHQFSHDPIFQRDLVTKKESDGWEYSIPSTRYMVKTDLVHKFNKYHNKSFFMTHAIKEYVNNNFQWKEDIKHKQTILISITAVVTAIIIAIISPIINYFLMKP